MCMTTNYVCMIFLVYLHHEDSEELWHRSCVYVCGCKVLYFWKEKYIFYAETKDVDLFTTTNYVCMIFLVYFHHEDSEELRHRSCVYVCGCKVLYFWKEKYIFYAETKDVDLFTTTNYVCMIFLVYFHHEDSEELRHRSCVYVCGCKVLYFWKEKKDFGVEKKVTDVFRTTNYVCVLVCRPLYRAILEKVRHRSRMYVC